MATLARRVVQPAYRDPISDEEASTAPSDWSHVSSRSSARRFSHLPTHDGQGLFEAESPLTTSLYPDLDGQSASSAALDVDSISWPSSMSATSSEPRSPLAIAASLSNAPLTQSALSRVASQTAFEADAQDPTALTSSDEEDQRPDPPLAISAGITNIHPRSRPLAPLRAGANKATKRRHRRSGVSDRGSKRSNTSGSQISFATHARLPLQERRLSLQPVTSSSRDLTLWTQYRSNMPKEPVDPPPAQTPRKAHPPIERFREFVHSEIGDWSRLSAALRGHDDLSDGEETEMENTPVRRLSRGQWPQGDGPELGLAYDQGLISSALSSYWRKLYRFLNGYDVEDQP